MSYVYSDPSKADDPTALPNAEVWEARVGRCDCGAVLPLFGGALAQSEGEDCPECGPASRSLIQHDGERGWWYAFGFPGCLHDSEPVGPFESVQEALDDLRTDVEDA